MSYSAMPIRGSVAKLFGALALGALLLATMPALAQADFGFSDFDVTYTDASSDPETQAGSHPFAQTTSFTVNTVVDPVKGELPEQSLRDLVFAQNIGLAGDPSAIPTCPRTDFNAEGGPDCPLSSIVGQVTLKLSATDPPIQFPVYNLRPRQGVAANIGFRFSPATIVIDLTLNPDPPYNVIATTRNTSQTQNVYAVDIALWGVPGDPAHDADRGGPAGVPETPFLTLPRACTGPLATDYAITSWQGGSASGSVLTHDALGSPQGLSGCANVPFNPQVQAQPTTSDADSPSGFDFNINIDDPGLTDPNGIAGSDLKKAVVTLPEGMAVNPSSADGLQACSPSQVAQETAQSDFGSGCPAASKIGSVDITTPLLDEHVQGSIFLATQGTNPFNSLLAGYIVAKSNERGINIVLPGKISPDPVTGQLTAVFDNNPQLPFSNLDVHFKTGDRAPLVTPSTCGVYDISTELTPWSGNAPVTRHSSFTIDHGPDGGPCLAGDPNLPGNPADLAARPLDPTLSAGLLDNTAGAASPFVLRLTRPDGHQEISSLEVMPPPGLSAILKGVPLCPVDQAQAGTCAEASKIGTSTVGAGAGPSPFYVQGGNVYLSGPYDPDGDGPSPEAPLSLAISVPAVAGPFDLGLVTVMSAIYVDPRTTQLRVVSDPIPQILEGIPLHVRDIRVSMNRPGFTIAPTNCSPMTVDVTTHGISGAIAHDAVPFGVDGCQGMQFAPDLTFTATGGKKATRKNQHPGLLADLSCPPTYFEGGDRQTNIAHVEVTLPKLMLLDQSSPAFQTICTRPQYAAGACPPSTQVGVATATTPLLDEPLTGPVYLKSSDNQLPDLAADLNGIIDVDLFGRIDQDHKRIRNSFDVVPDQPVSHFSLELFGGRDGVLVNANAGKGLCDSKARRRVHISMSAQNGDGFSEHKLIKAKCPKKKGHGRG